MSEPAPRLEKHPERNRLQPVSRPSSDLASHKPGFGVIPKIVWYPLTAAITVWAAGFIGLAGQQLWLFPSLAPTAYILTTSPKLAAARWYNTVVGHLIAMGMGFLSVLLVGASHLPSAMSSHHLMPARIWASGLAVLFSLILQLPLKAVHPPSASTALLITLGAFSPAWSDARTITFGVLIASTIGELFRQIELRSSEA